MYKQVPTSLNFVDREKAVEKFWEDNNIFKKSMEHRKEGETYTFYDGPPTANGKPHIGHVETRTIKDMIPRYRTMKGYMVPRKAGWDTHGLPVELEVEKLLGLDGKEQIEEYGLAPFIDKCKESVWKYKGMWEDFSRTVGFWADMDNPYVTYDDNFIESEWWALKTIWDKGLLYKGFKIVPYCPRCGTPLSSHEVAQGYKAVKERSAIVRFKVKGEDAYFLAWTTTPWTLPSNVALCVNPEETYLKVKAADGYTYYIAKALADKVLGRLAEEGKDAYEVLETYVGKDLEYKEYEPLYKCAGDAAEKQKKKAHFVTCDGYVTMTDGTGIVHIAPAFGEDDSRIGRNYELPFVQFVDGKGDLTAETPYAGKFVKDADPLVLKDLDAEGKLFDAPKFEHDYPFCWRCDTPLIYYARESWFIKMTAVKDDLVRNNKTINWIPASIGEGRFGNWLENIQDWGVSRNRYWGTPLNIWECECGHQHSIGSREELYKMSGNEKAKTVEFHRPYIDEITITCPECGKQMKRVPEVIDCWFDSGAMPFAQHHYPFENKDLFEQQFPADFISEAVDQTRGWFYSLLAESTLLFNKAPYKNVIVMGHVQDENGQKMSKSKGNAVDPFNALETYGADAIRWYFYTSSAPWLPKRFSGKAVQEGQRKFMGTLWNTYAFFVLYANIDNFDASKYTLEYDKLPVMDKWLLSKLNSTVAEVDSNLDQYRIPEAAKALQDFVDEMSNWYVRRSRERFWAKGMEQDKINAYMTLYTALVTICKAAAPMIPFMTEDIYQNLVRSNDANAPESIHLCDFPVVNKDHIDKKLEEDMEDVLDAVVMGRACRNEAAIKNRQPISRMYIKSDFTLSEFYQEIIEDELNVKEVVFTDDVRDFTSYTFKPQLRTVGPKYGKQLGGIQKHLAALDGNAAMDELNADGALKFDVDGVAVELTKDDLLIDMAQKEGYVSQEDNRMTVVLDTNLTPELVEEGFVYEIISKIQTMRKESGFEVTDHIRVSINGNDKLSEIAQKNKEAISGKVLADELTSGAEYGVSKEWNINGENAVIAVERV
ncbi:isoleucine--tRNA ligase [Waltera intestinalis]|jgi:isoleucyl-tRNA synthetase|uniref:Isoleucine--tRNA ligase n=1 Tax=Waltera intestinalis TaxID=2606635 RepID=A0A6L5YGN3_9FIRM|nr:isoleucine--tRNA ligase [Waltera intestinalis]MBO5162667.1 isoleucine--tRNA ligase [Lachnospiraceae bacterium]MST57476.1 isoleucine--tRNA ligase [Waltera intestinalis]HBW02590.1 isoleucine--tRNA ligase [Lachnospiraceae bacterium]